MLWGNGTVDSQDAERLKAFEHMATVPPYVLGFEEPDCPSGEGSAGMSVKDGVAKWESLIAPLRSKGAKIGSPSMCSTSPALEPHWGYILKPTASFQNKSTRPGWLNFGIGFLHPGILLQSMSIRIA